ncbi:MAG: hypothetical protein ACI8W8_004740 [Rhodothermales bacterium]|jgi:hypothetical protein
MDPVSLDRDTLLAANDQALLAACRSDNYRASGPGGQHRNTTDSAVRLNLKDSDIVVTATERRSQKQNREQALTRLRHAIALKMRQEPQPPWDGHWPVSMKNARYPSFIALILDQLTSNEFQIAESARALGVSTNKLVKVLENDPHAWTWVNRERESRDSRPLRRK